MAKAKTSTRLGANGTRAQAAAGASPIERYAVKKESPSFTDDTGREHWTREFRFPAAVLKELAPHLKKNIDNLLPGSNRLDVYAPCIHSFQMADTDDGQIAAVCDYQRPTREMILQPGRAFFERGSYVTTVKEETAIRYDGREVMVQLGVAAETIASSFITLQIKEMLTIKHRGVVTVYEADHAKDEWALEERAEALLGTGGYLQIDDQHVIPSLKLADVEFGRRASDLSIIDSTWKFSQNREGWRMSPYVIDSYYCVDRDGNTLNYDQTTRIVTDSKGNVMRRGQYMLVRLNKYDPDIITGLGDFSAFTEYFKWMT